MAYDFILFVIGIAALAAFGRWYAIPQFSKAQIKEDMAEIGKLVPDLEKIKTPFMQWVYETNERERNLPYPDLSPEYAKGIPETIKEILSLREKIKSKDSWHYAYSRDSWKLHGLLGIAEEQLNYARGCLKKGVETGWRFEKDFVAV